MALGPFCYWIKLIKTSRVGEKDSLVSINKVLCCHNLFIVVSDLFSRTCFYPVFIYPKQIPQVKHRKLV